jgi:hypothetical protein
VQQAKAAQSICGVAQADGVQQYIAPAETPGGGLKFNTVQGYTQTDKKLEDGTWTKDEKCPRSKVWIVYENGRAYPQYLVRYYRGAYDPQRVPFETREKALGAKASRTSMSLPDAHRQRIGQLAITVSDEGVPPTTSAAKSVPPGP